MSGQAHERHRSSLEPHSQLLPTPTLDSLIERLKDRGVLKQFPEHIAMRNGEGDRQLLRRGGFENHRILIDRVTHYTASSLMHQLRHLPVVGRYFIARLVIECIR